MPTLRVLSLALLLSVAAGGAANGSDRERDLEFANGATTARASGEITGRDGVSYRVAAVADQRLKVRFSASNGSCYFNVFAPGSEAAVHIGSTAGDQFSLDRTKPGVYQIQVYLMRNAARREERCRYQLTAELTPAGAPAVAASTKHQLCRREAAKMYGVPPSQIALAEARIVRGGLEIDGTADKQAEGVKKLRCIFDGGGRFKRIMAMTPDGE